jgi:hypothetical protein
VALQVWTALPEHCVDPGVHPPAHTPDKHACEVHGTGVPQVPPGSHACAPFPEHCFWPVVQGPEHWPAVQALLAHAAAGPHCPSVPHVCTPVPMHCVAPGMHTPAHAPATHAWFVQGVALPQAPAALQVCTPLPEHWGEPGAQLPTHPPLTQAICVQSSAAPHRPAALQVCTPLPEQRVVPGAQSPPPASPAAASRLPSSAGAAGASVPRVESIGPPPVAASVGLAVQPSTTGPASTGELLPELALHAATANPENIEMASRRVARPLIIVSLARSAPAVAPEKPHISYTPGLPAGGQNADRRGRTTGGSAQRAR